MGHTRNAITDLACHFLDHLGNKQFILDDQYARRVLDITGNAADDMTSGWSPGQKLMMTQHRLHRSGFIRLISGKRASRSQVPY